MEDMEMANDSTSAPLISVVMAVYNGDRYLRETIESVRQQTFTDFEFVIVDDGSMDQTWNILTYYSQQDSRLKLHQNQTNLGQTDSLNRALALAKGKYIARQDADDISLPTRFEKQVRLLDENPDVVMVSSDIDVIDQDGNYKWTYQRGCHSSLVCWYLLFHNYISGHSQVMFRRETILELGGYAGTHLTQDYRLWSRFSRVGIIAIIPEVLLKYREHGSSLSSQHRADQLASSMSISKQNIEQLTQDAISFAEIQALRGYWELPLSFQHYSVMQEVGAAKIQKNLSKIFPVFIQNYPFNDISKQHLAKQIKITISQQFIHWSHSIKWRLSPLEKARVSLYALLWHPGGTLNHWLGRLFA